MTVTKKALPRRTLLRAMGTAVALPVLDAMVPAFTAQARTAMTDMIMQVIRRQVQGSIAASC